MPDVDPRVDDPLGDISTVVHAAERVANFVFGIDFNVPPEIQRDVVVLRAVCERLKDRL